MARKFSEIIQSVRESALGDADFPIDEACWDTHKQVGMKKKGDRMVPDCVPKNEQFASDKPEPGREPVDNRFTSRSSKPVHKPAPLASPRSMSEDLRKWFNPSHPEGGWKRINSKGEAIGPCAREPGEAKPKCMSNAKRAGLSKKERASAVAAKRKHDPNPERKGAPINVSNYGKGKLGESMEQIDEKNEPTNPSLWARAKSLAKQKFDVYPSAYANGWASKWYKSKGGGWKSVNEAKEEQEYDYEGDMAMSDLRSILHNAKTIHDMLEPKTNMPEWCQSKITLAEDYLSTVANYLRGEMNEEVESLDEKGPGLWANIRAKKARGEKMRKPGEEGAPTEAQLKSARNEEVESIEEMPGANMDTLAVHKHLRKTGWSLTRTKGGHDVYTHPKSEKHIAVPRHRQLKAPLVRGIMKDAQVSEDVEHMTEANPSAMSRAKEIAKNASRKKVMEQDHNNQVDNVQTPAKQSLAFRGVVKNMAKPTKEKKTKEDKFEAEPELNTQIMRNN